MGEEITGSDRVAALLAELTLDEKCELTAGDDAWHTRPVERLGIPRLKVTDGPNGARGDAVSGATAACFPVGSALAASWDIDLLDRVGAALADEAKSKGAQVLLGPTANLHRTPLGGRNFECYSEDPILTGRLAAAFIQGLQRNGVGASIKHYVANDSEYQRLTISSEVDERTLRELYLRPFEIAVAESDPWTIMAAYNRINGLHACEHRRLLTEVLRDEWGWPGLVVSDWGAVHSTAPVALAGCDLEMPGPAQFLGPKLADAVRAGEVAEADVDLLVTRLLALLERSGRLDEPAEAPERSEDSPEQWALTREAAVAGMVLLKDDGGLLPLEPTTLGTVAVIGPNAETGTFQGGGSSQVLAHRVSHPLAALRARLGDGVTVTHEPGCLTHKFLPELPPDRLGEPNDPASAASDDDIRPVHLTVFAGPELDGAPVAERRLRTMQSKLFTGRMPGVEDSSTFGARYATTFVPRRSGLHNFSLCAVGQARLVVEGEVVVDNWTDPQPGHWFFGFASTEVTGSISLDEGVPVELSVEYGRRDQRLPIGVRVGLLEPVGDDLLDRAVEAAAAADVAILLVGTTGEWETEGNDRELLALPGEQDELIRRVTDVQPNTVVVLNAGSPVDVRAWIDNAPALLQVWFPGQAFGEALADVLLGDQEPGGRLPTTFPLRFEDCPAFLSYPGEGGRVVYGEGIFAGYRGYDERDVEVAFPFGHGLGYTTFEYGPAAIDLHGVAADPDLSVTVRVEVTNAGERAGSEVVQCYVSDVDASVRRAPRELQAFAKVHLQPGETTEVNLTLDRRAFAFWHPRKNEWTVEPGEFEISVGRSSRDLRADAIVEI